MSRKHSTDVLTNISSPEIFNTKLYFSSPYQIHPFNSDAFDQDYHETSPLNNTTTFHNDTELRNCLTSELWTKIDECSLSPCSKKQEITISNFNIPLPAHGKVQTQRQTPTLCPSPTVASKRNSTMHDSMDYITNNYSAKTRKKASSKKQPVLSTTFKISLNPFNHRGITTRGVLTAAKRNESPTNVANVPNAPTSAQRRGNSGWRLEMPSMQ